MISDLIEQYTGFEDSALDAEIRQIELEHRVLQARLSAAIATAEHRQLNAVDGHHSMKGYLRATCNWSSFDTAQQRRLARLVDTVPSVGDALLDGHIGVAQAIVLAKARSNPRVGDQIAAIAPVLLDHAEHLSLDDFKICVARWVVLADLDGSYAEMEANVEHRKAQVTDIAGAVDIKAVGGDPLVAAKMIGIFDNFVQAEFRKDIQARRTEFGADALQHPLPRTAHQRKFDALESIFDAAILAPTDGKAPEPIVNIIADSVTIEELFVEHGLAAGDGAVVDLDDMPTAATSQLIDDLTSNPANLLNRRCETSTGIVLHPELLLRAALTGRVRRLVVDSKGVVIDQGRTQRLFTGNARIAAQLVARRCGHDGCTVKATFADVDHMDEWVNDRGHTNQRNANIRCDSHDRWKYRNRWRSRRAENGRVYNIRPDGTIVLPVGERPPDLTEDETDRIIHARFEALIASTQTQA